jgi:SAM-dependent methyltransferase
VDRQLYSEIRRIEADHWWYVGRRRILFPWIQEAASAHTSPRILDVGCGTGFNLEQLAAAGFSRAVGLDPSSDALMDCRSRRTCTLVQANGAFLPFAASSFEVVVALDVIEHIQDDESALKEIARVLAPGGTLVLFTPAYRFLWSAQDDRSHHFRRYTSRELRAKLTRSGLQLRKLTYANTFLFPIVLAGRVVLKLSGGQAASENHLHPAWSNGLLAAVFGAEAGVLKHVDLPFGVSLLAVATRAAHAAD